MFSDGNTCKFERERNAITLLERGLQRKFLVPFQVLLEFENRFLYHFLSVTKSVQLTLELQPDTNVNLYVHVHAIHGHTYHNNPYISN